MGTNSVFIIKKIQNSETDLIHQLQLRNEKAFTFLYTAYSPALFIRIKTTLGCMLDAEEILHNVFLKIWLHINDYSNEKGSLFTWMISIARNESIDYLRSKQRKNGRVTISINEKDVKLETFINLKLDWLDLLKSVSLLPHEERSILELYHIGYTCREVGDLLSLPVGTVKTRMRSSYKKLREILA